MRLFRNMRLKDNILSRGVKAKKEKAKEPKAYPLEGGDWSSCDESEDESPEWLTVQASMGF